MDASWIEWTVGTFVFGWMLNEFVGKRLSGLRATIIWASDRRTTEAEKLKEQLLELRAILISVGAEMQRR